MMKILGGCIDRLEVNMDNQFFSLSQVADMLAVKPHRILYLLGSRSVPEPQMRVAGKRLWTLPEIALVSEKLKLQTAADWLRERGADE